MSNLNGQPDEINITHRCTENSEKYFTEVVGCIEELIMNEKFLELHTDFMERHWREFEDSEENKFIYTDIFKKYNDTVEKYIEEHLIKTIKDFNMCHFEQELRKRQNELDGEVFEILSTFSDFLAFKSMFLDYRAMKEGKVADFSQDFCVSKYYEQQNE